MSTKWLSQTQLQSITVAVTHICRQNTATIKAQLQPIKAVVNHNHKCSQVHSCSQSQSQLQSITITGAVNHTAAVKHRPAVNHNHSCSQTHNCSQSHRQSNNCKLTYVVIRKCSYWGSSIFLILTHNRHFSNLAKTFNLYNSVILVRILLQ